MKNQIHFRIRYGRFSKRQRERLSEILREMPVDIILKGKTDIFPDLLVRPIIQPGGKEQPTYSSFFPILANADECEVVVNESFRVDIGCDFNWCYRPLSSNGKSYCFELNDGVNPRTN